MKRVEMTARVQLDENQVIAHYDYFVFGSKFLCILCNKDDAILAYFLLNNGNEFGHIWVNPKFRGKGLGHMSKLVHTMIRHAIGIAKNFGYTDMWGVCYDKMKRYYEHIRDVYDMPIEFPESPADRLDGQWLAYINFKNIKDDNESNKK